MKKLAVIVGLFLFTSVSLADSWKIATLEWPPYICSKCYRNGAAAEALRAVLSQKGITVEFVFYPWVQAQKMGAKPPFVGYFPAWREEILPTFIASPALYSSPVVFMERVAAPLKWNQLKDLKGKTFAVTKGYGNTQEFNALVSDGSFKTVTLLSEESTISRLVAGSVDGVLIDALVGSHYLQNQFAAHTKAIQLNPQIVETKDLFFAFNKRSKAQAELFASLVSKQRFESRVEGYLKRKPPVKNKKK